MFHMLGTTRWTLVIKVQNAVGNHLDSFLWYPHPLGLIELMYEEYIDKIENLFNFGLKIEVPVVSFFRNDKGELEQDGVGFMEILDFEPTKDFVQRSLSFIKT